jgi:ketosteroid isomerase-like protein
MMRIAKCVLVSVLLATSAWAQKTTQTPAVLLNQFMLDASSGNPTGFERFFADEVIYTGSNGVVRTKADIMKSVNAGKPATANADKESYSAENVVVHNFGDTAIVAFQLVARTQHADGKIEISNYRDTGTFLLRNGRWQVIAWQATKIPEKAAAK